MNIFASYEDLLGTVDTGTIMEDKQQFWRLAGELRRRLGDKAYLLDDYLSGVFEGLGGLLAYDSAETGFSYGGDLRMLLTDVIRGNDTPGAMAHPFYPTVKSYVDSHSLACHDFHTKVNLYYIALADALMRYAAEEYPVVKLPMVSSVFNIAEVRELYCEIDSLLGEETQFKSLSDLIRSQFQMTTAMRLVVQGLHDNLLQSLIYRDPQTGKQVFQLVLDDQSDN